MKIISKFKDYYDSVLAYGQDTEIVYIRKSAELPLDKTLEDLLCRIDRNLPDIGIHTSGQYWRGNSSISTPFLIGFCGKIYPVIRLDKPYTVKRYPNDETKYHTAFTYSYDDVLSYLRKHKLYKELKDFEEEDCFMYNSRRALQKFFKLASSTKFQNIFLDHKIPIFAVSFKTQEITEITRYRGIHTKVNSNVQLSER